MFRSGFGTRLKRFRKDEEGSLIIFSMFIFLTMIIFGGIAVDLMMYENRRTHVQNATDRAVLAAANLRQTVTAKEVVKDYLAKVGIRVDDDDIAVKEVGAMPVVTGRQVAVRVEAKSPTMLMNMIGIDWLPYSGASEAEQSINDVEVSLILDISGSMGNPSSKLENMQQAASDFVDGVLEGADDNRVSLSLVPYSTQVSAGPALLDQLVTEHDHEFSHCVNFEEADFDTTAIQRWRPVTDEDGNVVENADGSEVWEPIPLSQTASFDPWNGWYSRSLSNKVCRDESYVDILPWSNDAEALKNQIDDFTADGNTSIDVAMKWGTALLDPSMRPTLNALEADGDDGIPIDSEFTVRPRDHDYEDVLKFIVLMTDGINTDQFYLDDESKEGMSDWYYDVSSGDYKVRVEDNGNVYWWDATDRQWESDAPEESERLTKLEMWNSMRMRWRAYNGYYYRTGQASDFYNEMGAYGPYYNSGPRYVIPAQSSYPNEDSKDQRLSRICTQAKNAGIVVFTIGFEVTDASAAVMEACASSEQHFYRVQGQDIQYAFASIKNQINQLKLTQ